VPQCNLINVLIISHRTTSTFEYLKKCVKEIVIISGSVIRSIKGMNGMFGEQYGYAE
jgi:hypothetical protein